MRSVKDYSEYSNICIRLTRPVQSLKNFICTYIRKVYFYGEDSKFSTIIQFFNKTYQKQLFQIDFKG